MFENIPLDGKIIRALGSAVGLVWVIDWMETIPMQKYQLIVLAFFVFLIFIEVKDD